MQLQSDILVNGTAITPDAIFQEMQYFPAETEEEAIQQAARSLVINALLTQRAESLGLDVGSYEAEDERINRLLESEVDIASPSEEECIRYFESHADLFSSSPLVEARHILLGSAPEDVKGRSEKLDQARAIIKRLQEVPGDFAKLAAKYSDCPSGKEQGMLGQLSRGQTVQEFEKVVFKLDAGLLLTPLESRYGVHVVYVERNIPGEVLPYETVADKIRTYLAERARRHGIADYLRRLADEAEIEGYNFSTGPLVQ